MTCSPTFRPSTATAPTWSARRWRRRARELAAGDAWQEAERAALARLLGAEGDLETLNRAFAANLRAGAFDGSEQAYAVLVRSTAARLAECNPGYETA